MEVSLIRRSDLGTERLERLDPEFVRASVLAMEERLLRMRAEALATLAPVNDGAHVTIRALWQMMFWSTI